MADTGWVYAGSGRNIDKGQVDWSNPGNITGANDSVYAANAISADNTGDELNAYNYTMGVPAGRQIDGIYCAILKLASSAGVKDYDVYLMDGTSHKGDDKADTGTDWPGSNTWVYYGGAADLWGASWTAAQVNASTFGLVIRANNPSLGAKTCYVDSMAIKVYYSNVSASNYLMMMGM